MKMIGDEYKEQYRSLLEGGEIELCLLLMRSNKEFLFSSLLIDDFEMSMKRLYRKPKVEMFIVSELCKLHSLASSCMLEVGNFLENFCGFSVVRYLPYYQEKKSIHHIIDEGTSPQILSFAYSDLKNKIRLGEYSGNLDLENVYYCFINEFK